LLIEKLFLQRQMKELNNSVFDIEKQVKVSYTKISFS